MYVIMYFFIYFSYHFLEVVSLDLSQVIAVISFD